MNLNNLDLTDMNNRTRIVLFDLGGVLADLGEPTKTIGLDLSDEQFWQIWLNSPHVNAFERGELAFRESPTNSSRLMCRTLKTACAPGI
jgi:hypothetical protein